MKQIHTAMLILSEECAEVIQAVSKCCRFGFDTVKPDQDQSNTQHLEEELGDVLAMIDILIQQQIVSSEQIQLARRAKITKLQTWNPELVTDNNG
jgi:NTP pyrophosphatase (non-canonical NTP hydrolase)